VPERVLLVLARDAGLASALRSMLVREGFPVRTGNSWGEGVRERWPGERFAAVLVDARLLADDPDHALGALREAFSGALLVVMAGRREHPVLVASSRAGALPLAADFDLDELVATLRGDDGPAGVREPRRPYAPVGTAGAVLPPPVT
jgi:DNA-binding NtrC family response regulator